MDVNRLDVDRLELIREALARQVPPVMLASKCGEPEVKLQRAKPFCQYNSWIDDEWLFIGRNIAYLVGRYADGHCFIVARNSDNLGECTILMPHAPDWRDIVRAIHAIELSGRHTQDGPRPLFLKDRKTGRPVLAIG